MSSESLPPGCKSSPTILFGSERSLSTTATFRPCRAKVQASADPSTPDPIITTSKSDGDISVVTCHLLYNTRLHNF